MYVISVCFIYVMDNNDSPDGPECVICLKKIGDFPYAMIDQESLSGRYHIECLEQWLSTSHNKGVLTQNATESYSLYQNDQLIETININKKLNDQIVNISETPVSETEALLDNPNESATVGCECSNGMKASLACGAVVIFILIYLFIIFFPDNH